ncbi:MAG: enoyl-CoA hydratase/isomerase family protein [Ignavibacteria bacterium]|nr:enoyl-CoA hydratase/isomerase family protein [Ignavibacteria bacterium]
MKLNTIIIEEKGQTKKIIMNRPEKRNSLDEEMISELTETFHKISEDKETKSIILAGAAGNFCSGLYLDYLHKISEYDILENKADSQKFRDLLLSIYNCKKPVIALVEGYALAGGCGIASACDIIVADKDSQFGYTEVRIGFIPAIVMIFLLKRVTESHAKDLLLTSKFINGEEAKRIGFVNYVTTAEDLESTVMNLCTEFNALPQSSISLTKEMFKNVSSMSFGPALDYAVDMNAITRMTEECRNGVKNFLTKIKK